MQAARALWARTTIRLWPESYRLVSLPVDRWTDALLSMSAAGGFAAVVRERDEISLTVEEDAWSRNPLQSVALNVSGRYRAITLDLQIELTVVGYLAPAAMRLAAAGISIVPQCAYERDHLLVLEDDAARAVEILQAYVEECRNSAATS